MDRDQILAIIVKHLKLHVDNLEDTEVNSTKSMSDYGACSLDIVEVVSASMRELQLKIPRTQLVELKNIDELADLFYQEKKNASS